MCERPPSLRPFGAVFSLFLVDPMSLASRPDEHAARDECTLVHQVSPSLQEVLDSPAAMPRDPQATKRCAPCSPSSHASTPHPRRG